PVTAADTNGKDFGVGLYLGSPLGVTAKYDLDSELSVVGGLGFGGGIIVSGGVQYKFIDFSIEDLDFNVYFGGNLSVTFGTFNIGLEVPVGISYYFKDPSIEVFLEVGPKFNFVTMNAGAVGGIGARYELDL
ncbi:MAG: hypothetical protein HQ557_11060, partial [Bacteroidetes bacterium]|nr:hypothetical protein [Bacteroidota bacterium]